MVAHIHAELMAQYAQDAAETETPWDRWEFYSDFALCWQDVPDDSGMFRSWLAYRRKANTVLINGHDVPKPLDTNPKTGDQVWAALCLSESPDAFVFGGSAHEERWVSLGLIHATEEAAQTHLDALLSFTRADK